jgi:hypothetical protein
MLSAEDKAEIPIAEFIEDVAAYCQARESGAAPDSRLA